LVCRTEHYIDNNIRKKIAAFCNVQQKAVIESIDAETIYDVPLLMQEEKLDEVVLEKLGLDTERQPNLTEWKEFLRKYKDPKKEVTIGLVGKYVELQDAYKSISEAFIHAGAHTLTKVNIKWIHSEELTDKTIADSLANLGGIIVCPGFGERGLKGKLEAIKYARTKKIPFFGICLGMQCAVIEFAQNVLGLKTASSKEMDSKTRYPVIDLMESQKGLKEMGGTMRLGAYKCDLKKGSFAYDAYKKNKISERHRHRYEFNNKYLEKFEKAGMIATGKNPDTDLVEIVEIPDHPWFVGAQFHPEYKSTVENPHPLFMSFVQAALKASDNQLKMFG
jgi:CTP synthase